MNMEESSASQRFSFWRPHHINSQHLQNFIVDRPGCCWSQSSIFPRMFCPQTRHADQRRRPSRKSCEQAPCLVTLVSKDGITLYNALRVRSRSNGVLSKFWHVAAKREVHRVATAMHNAGVKPARAYTSQRVVYLCMQTHVFIVCLQFAQRFRL